MVGESIRTSHSSLCCCLGLTPGRAAKWGSVRKGGKSGAMEISGAPKFDVALNEYGVVKRMPSLALVTWLVCVCADGESRALTYEG